LELKFDPKTKNFKKDVGNGQFWSQQSVSELNLPLEEVRIPREEFGDNVCCAVDSR